MLWEPAEILLLMVTKHQNIILWSLSGPENFNTSVFFILLYVFTASKGYYFYSLFNPFKVILIIYRYSIWYVGTEEHKW